jgi:histone demethylase JARID1
MQPSASTLSSRDSPSRRGRSPRATGPTQAALQPDGTTNALQDQPTPTFTSSLAIAVQGVIPIEKSGESSASLSFNMHSPNPISNSISSSLPSQPPAASVINHSVSAHAAYGTSASAAAPHPNGDARRAPRKSKMDALAALNVRSRSPSYGLEDAHSISRERSNTSSSVRHSSPIPVTTSLNMNTVKTASPRNLPPRTKARPFELEDCPVYYPTSDEFKNPMSYIRSISEDARNYGICKIIPPEDWKMPFVTDTEARLLNLLL